MVKFTVHVWIGPQPELNKSDWAQETPTLALLPSSFAQLIQVQKVQKFISNNEMSTLLAQQGEYLFLAPTPDSWSVSLW